MSNTQFQRYENRNLCNRRYVLLSLKDWAFIDLEGNRSDSKQLSIKEVIHFLLKNFKNISLLSIIMLKNYGYSDYIENINIADCIENYQTLIKL